jgi:hypothetical protein
MPESYELTGFNLTGHIPISRLGLLKIMRAEDGRIMLITETDLTSSSAGPRRLPITPIDSALALVLDIGINREMQLCSDGFYWGKRLTPAQSMKKISADDFDGDLLDEISRNIESNYQASDKKLVARALKCKYLLDAYNNTRLLFPRFLSESYLGLIRILNAVFDGQKKGELCVSVVELCDSLAQDVYKKVSAVNGFAERLSIAESLFKECSDLAERDRWGCTNALKGFLEHQRFMFACLFAAYEYRNKFIHQGFPIPEQAKESWGVEDGLGTAYLHPSLSTGFMKVYRSGGMNDEDYVDIHAVFADDEEAEKAFKERYYPLLPTWHFLKTVTRHVLINYIRSDDVSRETLAVSEAGESSPT